MPIPQEKTNVAVQQNTPDVMGQVAKQRTPAKRMETIDILAQALAGTDQNPVMMNNALAKLVQTDPKFRIMRANNSLFGYYNLGDGTVEVMLETADNPRDLVDSVKQFAAAMKKSGFKKGKFQMENPQLPKVLQMAGLNAKIQSMPTVDGQQQMVAVVEV